MSTRWFFSSARVGAAAAATGGPALPTSVTFNQQVDGRQVAVTAPGPELTLLGPGDVTGFDRAIVQREEPPPGTVDAAENIMASVELTQADVPWLLSPGLSVPGRQPLPWLVLVVLDTDEAPPPRDAAPLPLLTAPLAALPPLSESWAWVHVEARLDDGVLDPEAARQAAAAGVRAHSAGVVGRLLCPRQLLPDRTWIAAVVPATKAGADAGRGRPVTSPPAEPAWVAGGPGVVELPVYHWWTFRTGAAGTFEELARKLEFTKAADAGLGTRVIDVGRPWPAEDAIGPATVAIDGALRVPGPPTAETWSDPVPQQRFRDVLRDRIDLQELRRTAPVDDAVPSVGPPLYGTHHTGVRTVPADPGSWLTTLNLEVRRRVAAALGARYVQLEQEFLMARAWEQAGEIRAANRLLAATELAAAAAERAQHKHLDPLPVTDLVTTMAPVRNRLRLSAGSQSLVDNPITLAASLAPDPTAAAVASTAFARLTRRGGALARRAGRIGAGEPDATPVLEDKLINMRFNLARDGGGLTSEVTGNVSPVPLQLRRMSDRIPTATMTDRAEDERRPLGPIMAHPRFAVPIAEELLARWPEWAIPGIGGLPPNSVTLLETNPEFVAALLVGLNQEFNRELLWREFPTDQRGTPFARFWPTEGDDVDEIARWPVDAPLGSQLRSGAQGSLALLVRGELLRRFPGTALLAVRGDNGRLPAAFGGIPATPLPLDESTTLYLVPGLSAERARNEDWFLVFREPMRGTQFGFDSGPAVAVAKWADLTWDAVSRHTGRFARADTAPASPNDPPGDPARWGTSSADMARIAFQQPFQLAFRAAVLLRP